MITIDGSRCWDSHLNEILFYKKTNDIEYRHGDYNCIDQNADIMTICDIIANLIYDSFWFHSHFHCHEKTNK